MRIGNISFETLAFLAPMAGIADLAFRELCADFGAGYTVSEMVSSKGIVMGDKKSKALLTLGKARPAGVQIFGNEPDTMAKAAEMCQPFEPQIIDINMGCPAPKIAMNGGGAALMKNPKLVGEIVNAVSHAVDIPVTVKIRKGFDDSSVNAAEIAKLAEENGAAAITIHGRTRNEMYSGKVDLDIIKRVKDSVSIPVIANGDVTDAKSAARTLEETGCDAIMIGRGALGNPWIFQQINAYLSSEALLPPPGISEKMNIMLRQISKTIEYKGEYIAMREARHHAAYYTKGLRGGAVFRREISSLQAFEELVELSMKIIEENS